MHMHSYEMITIDPHSFSVLTLLSNQKEGPSSTRNALSSTSYSLRDFILGKKCNLPLQ